MGPADSDECVEGLTWSELVDCLTNSRPEVRAMGAQVALSLTATEEGRRGLTSANVLAILCRLTADRAEAAEPAVSALINVCADELPQVVEELLKRGIVDRLMETVSTPDCTFRDKALMLLANVTATETGSKRMMQVGGKEEGGDAPSLQGLNMRRLLRWFLSNYSPEAPRDDWQHVASVVCNVSQLQEGRDLLRRKSTALLYALLPQLQSENVVRRRGVAGAIRNCCFEEDDHWWLLHEVNVVAHILRALMGPVSNFDAEDVAGMDPLVLEGGEDKAVEMDRGVRSTLLETLLLFCASRSSRETLRKMKTYPIVREVDLLESDQELSEVIYKIVNFLQRDEGKAGQDINQRKDAPEEVDRPRVAVRGGNSMDALD